MSPVFGHGRLRLYLLKLLDESPRHGYDLIRELEDRFMGLYSPSAGTIYPRLARLEAEGLVTHSEEDGRKTYTITEAGRAELRARQGELDDLEADIAGSVRDLADEIRSEVHGSVRDLKAELKAAARDVRREGRARARQQGAHAGGSPGGRVRGPDGEDLADWLNGQFTRVVNGRWPLTDQQRGELRAVLARAVDDVRRIVLPDDPRNRPPQDSPR
jgi:DNA-binding PadR family transcriptional regulator